MTDRLTQKGINAIHTNTLHIPALNLDFGVFSCLNVLDRCEDPMEILDYIIARMRGTSSKLILALALPWRPIRTERPIKFSYEILQTKLPSKRFSFEQWLRLWIHYLEKLELEIITLSRVPYLSQGNGIRPYFVLHDAIIVLQHKIRD